MNKGLGQLNSKRKRAGGQSKSRTKQKTNQKTKQKAKLKTKEKNLGSSSRRIEEK